MENILPGFMILFGSIADLILFIISTAGTPAACSRKCFFASPVPCSPVIVPPNFIASLNIKSNAL